MKSTISDSNFCILMEHFTIYQNSEPSSACAKASAKLLKFSLAFFVGDCCVCPGEVQRPDHVLVAVLRRDVQHRLPLRLIHIHVGMTSGNHYYLI